VLRRILWTAVILLGGGVALERSADILMFLSPYPSTGSLPRGMSPARVPLLATVAVDEPAPGPLAAREPAAPEAVAATDPEPFEEPAAYMAAPLRTQVTTFDGPPAPETSEPPAPDQSFAR